MKHVLQEMPHVGMIKCPNCHLKFYADGKVETWTGNKQTNRRFLDMIFKTRKMPLTCPNCNADLIFDASTHTTSRFEDIYKQSTPSIKQYFLKAKNLIKPKMVYQVVNEDTNHLTFERFINMQNDETYDK